MKINKQQLPQKPLRVVDEGSQDPHDESIEENAVYERLTNTEKIRLKPVGRRHGLRSNEIDGFKVLEQEGGDRIARYQEDPDKSWGVDEEEVKKQPLLVVLSFVLGFALVLSGLLYFGMGQKDSSTYIQMNSGMSLSSVEKRILADKMVRREIEDVLRAYFAEDTWAKRLPYMRPMSNALKKIRDYEKANNKKLDVYSIDSVKFIDPPENMANVTLMPVFVSVDSGVSLFGYCVQINNEWKIDWEASAAWQPIDFSKLDEIEAGSRAIVRTFVSEDRVYLSQFPEEKYVSLRLDFLDHKDGFYGFIEKNPEEPSWIEERITQSESEQKSLMVLIEIEFKFKLLDRWVVEVTRLVNKNWVAPEEVSDKPQLFEPRLNS